jgi:hypothetical protein
MDHFFGPMLLDRLQKERSDFPHAPLERTELQWLIASGGETL